MKTRSVVLLALFASAPVAAQAPTRIPTFIEPQVQEFAKRVKSVKAEPAAITMRVGQKLNLTSFTLLALDSADKVHGRLTTFDFAVIPPGEAASVLPTGLTAERAGTTTLILRYPRGAWTKVRTGTRPEAKVSVTVTP